MIAAMLRSTVLVPYRYNTRGRYESRSSAGIPAAYSDARAASSRISLLVSLLLHLHELVGHPFIRLSHIP